MTRYMPFKAYYIPITGPLFSRQGFQKILPNFWSIPGTLIHVRQNRTFRDIAHVKNRLVATGF